MGAVGELLVLVGVGLEEHQKAPTAVEPEALPVVEALAILEDQEEVEVPLTVNPFQKHSLQLGQPEMVLVPRLRAV